MIKKALRSDFIILLFAGIVTLCIIAGGIVVLNLPKNPTHKFLLPKGFTGWVQVTYRLPDYPALKKEGNMIIYEVPPSGRIMTSSKNFSGTMILNYVEQDGRLIELPKDVPMIHGQGTSEGLESLTNSTFL